MQFIQFQVKREVAKDDKLKELIRLNQEFPLD